MTTFHFLPRERLFWLYHGGATLFTLAVTLSAALLYGSASMRGVVNALLWMPLYTLVVLYFRRLFRLHDWQRQAIGRLILLVVLYGSASGVLLALAVLGLEAFTFGPPVLGAQTSPLTYVLRILVGNGLQNQLFICAWCFIYVSVVSSRVARQGEMANLQLQNRLKEAQLSSLASQLNPHFLFNSLNNLRFLIHENAVQADAMVIALADILRYAIDSGKRDKVMLRDELEIIRRYLLIVGVQLERRLQWQLDVPAELEQLLVPPMMLQMLVENAVKHGIEHLPAGGRLELTAQRQGKQLCVLICNDMPVQNDASAPSSGLGIGLENSRQRLELLYGARAALRSSQHHGQFHIEFIIPAEHTP